MRYQIIKNIQMIYEQNQKDISGLNFIKPLVKNGTQIHALNKEIREKPGVYCFWGEISELEYLKSSKVLFQGQQLAKNDLERARLKISGHSNNVAVITKYRKAKYKNHFEKIHYIGYKTRFHFDKNDRNIYQNKIPLYIGKSTNIKERIKKHLLVRKKCRCEYLTIMKKNKVGSLCKWLPNNNFDDYCFIAQHRLGRP
jgi:hypothetical protein